jgi:predicted extracellular nuclease
MAAVRVATFNAMNLFARYRFKSNVEPQKAIVDGWRADERKFEIFDAETKKVTAEAIAATNADIVALQEIENLDTLKRFRSEFLKGRGYAHAMLIDGNDPRQIDVAVLSRYPIVCARSYQHETVPGGESLFSRDCLVVDIAVAPRKTLTLFVNHLKSMLDKKDRANGRRNSAPRRRVQAERVVEIVRERFGARPGDAPFVVLGDLNDYMQTDDQGAPSIDALVAWNQVENVVDRLPQAERWTHFWADKKAYRQLDYLLPSKALAAASRGLPVIERRGLPKSAVRVTARRFTGIESAPPSKKDRAASDHCPLAFDLEI